MQTTACVPMDIVQTGSGQPAVGLPLEARDLQEAAYTGQGLRAVREQRHMVLKEVAAITKIQVSYLESIEDEQYHLLPPEVFLKGYLKSYSVFLKIDPEQVVSDYMGRFDAWKQVV